MRTPGRLGWLLPCVVLTGASAGAQDAVSPLPGARLRVTARAVAPQPIVGSLGEITEREMILAVSASDRIRVPRAGMERVEWSRGRHGNALKGLLFGAAIGAVFVAVAGCSGETCSTEDYLLFAASGAGLGALPGAGVGALVKTERWSELPVPNLRVTVGPIPNQGVGVRLGWTR